MGGSIPSGGRWQPEHSPASSYKTQMSLKFHEGELEWKEELSCAEGVQHLLISRNTEISR